jgi:hypothetical protein
MLIYYLKFWEVGIIEAQGSDAINTDVPGIEHRSG